MICLERHKNLRDVLKYSNGLEPDIDLATQRSPVLDSNSLEIAQFCYHLAHSAHDFIAKSRLAQAPGIAVKDPQSEAALHLRKRS